MLNTNTIMLRAVPHEVRIARVFTAANLDRWGMPAVTDNAVLVVSELVTNAVKNSADGAAVKLWLWTDGQRLLIEVRDSGPGIPLLVDPSPDEDSGRGLAVVASLCKDWGCYPQRGGKVTWAHIGQPQD